MRLRFAVVGCCLLVGACAGISARVDDGVSLDKVRAENTGVVIVHTPLQEGCHSVGARVAQKNAEGQYVLGQRVPIKGPFDLSKQPGQFILPAGNYGIVELTCLVPRRRMVYTAPIAQNGSILDGSGRIYKRPLVEFTVKPGEVVDIGSIVLVSRVRLGASSFVPSPNGFAVTVKPIPEAWLQNLATSNPHLFAQRVVRLATVPGSEPSPDPKS